ncbi:MAG: peptidoglycan-binding domain-containing protein [Candidatus Paceibacterota bacterium]|jgi:peptidoglycan hydrolase-like protein with peptidoglycan-binding domain
MPKKTIIIFITVFVIIGLIVLGIYLFSKKDKDGTDNGTTPWYQNFNPFGTGTEIPSGNENNGIGNNNQGQTGSLTDTGSSRFYQVTDFAVAGATFLEDTRPVIVPEGQENQPKEIKTLISVDTKEGRKEIQNILNETLLPKTPLVADGNFGKLTTKAIEDFQKLKNLPITGKIDAETAPYFTKTITDLTNAPKYEQAPSLRYVERKNGHMYKMFLDTKEKTKISNSTIPGIYEAFFDTTAQTVIYRYLSEDKKINSFMATLGAPKGEFLPQNISDLSVSHDKTKFFYLVENGGGVTGTTGLFGNTKREVAFNSPFTEWLSQWTSGQKVFLTTKASYGVSGSIFMLDTTKKTLSKVFGGVMGLTTLVNPNGSLILYSYFSKTGPQLGIFDIAQHSTRNLDIYSLPEKCVWANDNVSIYCAVPNVIVGNQYPDYWYQGLISFDDYFIKINTETGNKTTIANSINETAIDGTHLFLDRTEENLFLINKKDSTLWSLNIK